MRYINFSECAVFALKCVFTTVVRQRSFFRPNGFLIRRSGVRVTPGARLLRVSCPLSAWSYGVAVKLIVTGVPEVPVAFVPLNGVATSVWLPAAGLHAV